MYRFSAFYGKLKEVSFRNLFGAQVRDAIMGWFPWITILRPFRRRT
jgi:hypothetical protein